ncbi:hypothetical protein MTBPR1_100036 [Candidatus Terasakiella magnetica]|uniref:Uncharacterized protein n=1 Tax=Candidatus Terasakiella magnetica TaxID=1867952 RepID=A0A1C3RDR2_9PROT|nr:hypothetical protein MTBPR1_100036 [Candidatus Terasakiella magnetica]
MTGVFFALSLAVETFALDLIREGTSRLLGLSDQSFTYSA